MFINGLIQNDNVVYDIEVYPNAFTFTGVSAETGRWFYFEVSSRVNQMQEFIYFMKELNALQCRMIGFNNVGYDYPVIHYIYEMRDVLCTFNDIYEKSMSIINTPWNQRFNNRVWDNDMVVQQIDLFMIHHFDNTARSTSLKKLEFAMRMQNIEDLPFAPGTVLANDEIEQLAIYNKHDVQATLDFYRESLTAIEFREQLSELHDHNFMNHNDTKIGKDFFAMKLEEADPGCCYKKIDGKKTKMQTPRESIAFADILLPYISFTDPEFKRIHEWFGDQVITETKGSITDISCNVKGFQFDFGTGGLHGSVSAQIVESDEECVIRDIDVKSYYPNIAIVNRLHPAHLGETFCTIYKGLYEQRVEAQKNGDDATSATLKLALNGVYGDSNNKYSPFYDPQYTMAITINGQLLLCMLAEALMDSDEVQMIQVNTDGVTIRFPRLLSEWVDSVQAWWEDTTNLVLETADYSRMMIRDVNNYIAEYVSVEGVDYPHGADVATGKLKRKGTYEYDLAWYQNRSALVVKKAAEHALVHGGNIREFVINHDNNMDFMSFIKVPKNCTIMWGGDEIQNNSRYYISTHGKKLQKQMPPMGKLGTYKKANGVSQSLYDEVMEETGGEWDERVNTKNKSKYEERISNVEAGWKVNIANRISDQDMELNEHPDDLDYGWYIEQAEKLVNCMR